MPGRKVDVDARERVNAAIKLRRNGMPWVEVAQQCDYRSADVARKLVVRALDRNEARNIDEWRLVQLDRLDGLFRAVWPQASRSIDPDVFAIDRVLNIMREQYRWPGLDRASTGGSAEAVEYVFVGVSQQELVG